MLKKRLFRAVSIGVLVGIAVPSINVIAGSENKAAEYRDYCEKIGQTYSICPELLEAIIEMESSGNPDALGADGDTGLMQVIPKYHDERMECLGVTDLYNPYSNILTAADCLAELFIKYEDLGTVLMIYNGTTDAVERGRDGDLTEYAVGILERSAELERLHEK